MKQKICKTTDYVRCIRNVGRVEFEEIILQLIKSKCLSILLYCSEVCPFTENGLNSLVFVINRFFIKLFKACDVNTLVL